MGKIPKKSRIFFGWRPLDGWIPVAVKGGISVTVEMVPQQHWLLKYLSTVGGITDEGLEGLFAAAALHVVL